MNLGSNGDDIDAICDFVNELGQLKRVDRAGWKLAGIPDVERALPSTSTGPR